MIKKIFIYTAILLMVFSPARIHKASAETAGTISVVSFDGVGQQESRRYIQRGYMPNLKRLGEKSAVAQDFVTVMPSLTAPSHAAMATGAGPATTGIVSNHFHSEGQKVKTDQSGFSQTLGVTPVWKEAANQGKTTATVAFPGSNPENASAATYAVYSGGTLAQSKLHSLSFHQIDDDRLQQLPDDHQFAYEAAFSLDLKDQPAMELYAVTVDQGDKSDATVYLSADQSELGIPLSSDGWTAVPLELPDMDAAGFYVKLKADSAGEMQLFQGTVMGSNFKGPDGFAEQLASEFGFYPAPDETEAFKDGDITRKEYEEAGERYMDWVTDVSHYIKKTYSPDLLFYYYPHVDHELHEYLLRDPRQPDYSEEEVQEKDAYISWAFRQADRIIGEIADVQGQEDYLFVVSDHGLEPIHTRLSPNKELEKAGLLKTDSKGKIIASETKAYAEASGTIAHVYLNLEGREKKGIVKPGDYEEIVRKVVDLFESKSALASKTASNPAEQWLEGAEVYTYRYPAVDYLLGEGRKAFPERPYEQVLTRGMEEYERFGNENSGDVFLSAASGYLMGKDAKIAVEPTMELGSHGSDPEREELRPILYISGPTVASRALEQRIQMVDIAPTLYRLLDLKAPDFVEGYPINLAK